MATNSINRTIHIPAGVDMQIYVDPKQQAKAQKLLDSMPHILQTAYHKSSINFGKRLARLVRKCLMVGQPPPHTGVHWQPHTRNTTKTLGPHPLLHYTGTYMRAIHVFQGKSRIYVGVGYNRQGGTGTSGVSDAGKSRSKSNQQSKLTLNQIAILHEFGGQYVPPRPLWRPAWKAVGGNDKLRLTIKRNLQRELKKYM